MNSVVRISDGLGNQMFQYAFARKLHFINKGKVYLDTRFINNEDVIKRGERSKVFGRCDYRVYGLEHFKIVLPIADDYMLNHWEYLERVNCIETLKYNMAKRNLWFWKNEDESNLNDGHIFEQKKLFLPTYFIGYFFDLRYFADIDFLLKKEFCLKTSISLPPFLYKILKNRNTVSIHIRKGDFVKLFRDISRTEYYTKALQRIKELVENPVYLIFSDDIIWVKNNMNFDGEKIYVSELGFKDYEELMIMKHCKHNIIANSTFSYWAAYLNSNPKKIVVCPKHWKTQIIPKEWISI